jgi:hypothetical protein
LKLPFTTNQIPPLDSFSDTLPKLRLKKSELHVEIAKRKAECSVIREQLNKGALDPGNDRQVRARRLLAEDVSDIPASTERLSQVQRELADYGTALSIIDGKIQTEEQIAGNKQYEAVKPEVDRLGKRCADAFLATRDAHVEYETIVNQLEDAHGNVSVLRISPAGLVNPSERNSPYAYGLRELSEAGFLPKTDVSKVL